jgi:hypothetical protein
MERIENVKDELLDCTPERLQYKQGYIQACTDVLDFFSQGAL